MKFSLNTLSALTALGWLVPSVTGFSQTLTDQYIYRDSSTFVGNSMWLFSSAGVYVYSPDGSEQRAHTPKELVCEDEDTFTGKSYQYCRFHDVVSDGKKYVWAATSRMNSAITIFDIDTGALVGNFKSCSNPHDLEFHPLRDEVWVRCLDIDTNSTDPTHLDVFSASNPSGEVETNILVGERALQEGLSSSGYSVISSELGDIGYITDDAKPSLFAVDLSTKDVIDTIDLLPTSHGLYEASFSPVNKHIYVRALMCCTCGTVDSDKEKCRGSPALVSPTTGKSAGQQNVEGMCGRNCAGIDGVDTLGLYEFDTQSKTVVATHLLAEGIGGDPYPSLNGKYIVMLGKNGGKTVRVLEAGSPGSPSSVLVDLELDFDREGYENLSVARDFAFVERNGKTLLVMPSGTSHKVAIVDFSSKNFDTKYVTFSDEEFVNTAPHGRYRSVEWAVGTDYVWTNDSSLNEHYVIDVVQGKLVKTVTGIKRSSMLSVQNWQRVREASEQEKLMGEMKASQEQAIANAMKNMNGDEDKKEEKAFRGTTTVSSSTDDEDASAIVVAALAVAGLALIVGIVNLVYMTSMNKPSKNTQNSNFEEHEKLPVEKLDDPRHDPLGVST